MSSFKKLKMSKTAQNASIFPSQKSDQKTFGEKFRKIIVFQTHSLQMYLLVHSPLGMFIFAKTTNFPSVLMIHSFVFAME
jgi:hypothetical protein